MCVEEREAGSVFHLAVSIVITNADDCVSFNDLERLPWLFEGEGDIQFNVYREIKKTTKLVCLYTSLQTSMHYKLLFWLQLSLGPVSSLHQCSVAGLFAGKADQQCQLQ